VKRAAFLLTSVCLSALAYNPPKETADSLTVEIRIPSLGSYGAGGNVELTTPHTPFIVPVDFTNSGSREIKGSIRIGVIDDWHVAPAAAVPFTVAAKGETQLEFTVRFGFRTHNAWYPIHAFVEFDEAGTKRSLHPVLLMQVKRPDPPRSAGLTDSAPVPVPAQGQLGLARLAVRREWAEIEQLDAAAPSVPNETWSSGRFLVAGYTANFGDARESIATFLGPRATSKRETVHSVVVEYPLHFPPAQSLRLEFATGGQPGTRFRIATPDGSTLFERTSRAAAWEAASVDLGRFTGRTIGLRFETRGDSLAAWATPTIIGGQPPAHRLGAPVALGQANGYTVSAALGNRGILDGAVTFAKSGQTLTFNGFRVRAAGGWVNDPLAGSELISVGNESAGGRLKVRHRFRAWLGDFDIVTELWTEASALRARIALENAPPAKPWLAPPLNWVGLGPWSTNPERVYGGPGNVIVKPEAFRLSYDGHNLASSFVGFEFPGKGAIIQATDAIPDALEVDPNLQIASLLTPYDQTITLIPAASAWDGVKLWRALDTRTPSAGVPKVASRFVFDLWSGDYGPSSKALAKSFEYGLTDSMVVWHQWQRWGYDYRLPDIYPPDPQFGSMSEFLALVDVCKRDGVLFAPHDNYIDFYPDSEGFSYTNMAFQETGAPRTAWFNYGRQAQSYRVRGDAVLPYMQRNLKLIKEGFAPTAYFIDVWTSIAPYDFWTHDGQFVKRDVTRKSWGESFAWIRDYLGGAPAISEAGHDQLIGFIDGAQAQHLRIDPNARGFAWRIRAQDSERIPWFDAAHHDRFILHGAGYPDRYEGGLDTSTHGIYSDDYISTEVLTGRPAMVSQAFGRDVVRKYWLLHDLMAALALRKIERVEFAGGDIHRQHVVWDNGAEVWVNRGATDWAINGHTLPQYGFYAKSGDVEAAIEKRDGLRVEWATSPTAKYADGARSTLIQGKWVSKPLPPGGETKHEYPF
jgi:hypothetical protein